MKIFNYLICLILASVLFTSNISAQTPDSNSYWYNNKAKAITVADAFSYKESIDLKNPDNSDMKETADMYIRNQKIYILDSKLGKISIYNSEFKLIHILSAFSDNSSNVYTLKEPKGIFVDANELIFIADTGNNRVLKCNEKGNVISVFKKPEGLNYVKNEADYLPEKIVVDKAGRIFVTARSVNLGIIVLSSKGEFITYIGAPPIKLDAYQLFWRQFSTHEQKIRMQQFVPTEYSNLEIDSQGFIYGTISAISKENFETVINSMDLSGSISPIKKLNSLGQDILRRQGVLPIIGDISLEAQSSVVDVTLLDDGMYSLLDAKYGKIFTYDSNGDLLFVFGGIGNKKSSVLYPVAIGYLNGRIIVLDSRLSQLIIFDQTEYGKTLFNAVKYQENGDFDKSFIEWQKVFLQNPSFDLAYVGVGKLSINTKEYEKAMQYFNDAEDMIDYSTAFELKRKQVLGKIFPIIFFLSITVMVLLFFKKYIKVIIDYCKN